MLLWPVCALLAAEATPAALAFVWPPVAVLPQQEDEQAELERLETGLCAADEEEEADEAPDKFSAGERDSLLSAAAAC